MAAWTNLGIFGGHVQCMAVDPVNPDKLFAGTYLGGGLFVSLDGGRNWQAVEIESQLQGEDDFEDHSVNAVAIAPGDPKVVWAAHNHWLAKSTDGGLTWTHIRNSTVQSECTDCGGTSDAWRYCMALSIHPQNPDVVYVGATGPNISPINGMVYKTTDGGLSWQKLNQGVDFDYMVQDVAVDAGNPDIVWAVTNSNGYGGSYDGTIYRSEDGGLNFTPINPKPVTGGILSVAPKPDDAGTVLITCGYGIVQLDFDGAQWNAAYPLWDINCRMASDVVFAPTDAQTVYACWMTPVNYWDGDDLPKISRGVYEGGSWTWETFAVDSRHANQLYTIAVSTADKDVIYGGDLGLGVVQSPDHGQTWTPVNEGLDAVLVYDVDVDDSDTSHMIAASGSGLYERSAGATRWERKHNAAFRSVAFLPGSGTAYFAGMDGYLARTDDNGATWTYSDFLDYARVNDIAVDPTDPDTVFIATGIYGQQVQRSVDGGGVFEPVLNGENADGQAYTMNTLAVDPADSQHILAGGGNFYVPYVAGDLWESYQGGVEGSWQRTGLTNIVVNAVLIDPRDSNRIYAGCGYSQNFDEPVYKSTDGGATWDTATLGMPLARRVLYSIWGPAEDNLFAVGSFGFITRYDGVRWTIDQSPTSDTLYGIFGLSDQDVFAVGLSGTILHYNGRDWEQMPAPVTEDLYKVWSAAADDAYAVGAGGTIAHYDGASWTTMASPTSESLYDVYGTAADHIFATGTGGVILHYDGSVWEAMASGITSPINGLWADGSGRAYAAGDGGVILHYDGGQWTAMPNPTSADLYDIWGSSSSDIYAAGPQGHLLYYDGQQWALIDPRPEGYYQEIHGFSQGRIVVSDYLGGVWQYDGQAFSVLREQGTYNRSVTDLCFHRSDPDIIYAGTQKAGIFITANQAGNWLQVGIPPSQVYAVTSGSLYAATGAGLYQLTGTGVLAGYVRDNRNLQLINGATVTSDIGISCTTLGGIYMMVSPTGIFDLFATDDNYQMGVASNLTVTGTEVTWYDFELAPGSSVAPGGTSGSDTTGRSSDAGGGGYCFIDVLAGDAMETDADFE